MKYQISVLGWAEFILQCGMVAPFASPAKGVFYFLDDRSGGEENQMQEKAVIMDEKAMARAIIRMSFEIIERNRGVENLCIIGILRRGTVIAQKIRDKISEVEGKEIFIGSLDITPYRDDQQKGKAVSDDSCIPFDVRGKKIVLVDDVIFTGRSVRAAIDAIMERGRPECIQLAALIDRGHRELPIRPDYVGKNVPTAREEVVRVQVESYDGENRVAILKGE